MSTFLCNSLIVAGAAVWFGPEYERVLAQNEQHQARTEADAYWRNVYISPAKEGACVPKDNLKSDMLLYYGEPCKTGPVAGFRVHAVIDCEDAHADMGTTGCKGPDSAAPFNCPETDRKLSLVDNNWKFILHAGRMTGVLYHPKTELRFDWSAPREAEMYGEVLRDELLFPTQKYGELFTDRIEGIGALGYRPVSNCVNTFTG